MDEEVHKQAAKSHFEVGNEFNKKRESEQDGSKRTAYMVVAAHNYFYCSINVIEYIFAREKKEHSFNHENRFRKVKEYFNLFPPEFLALYDKVERNLRNKVAYRGENSRKFDTMKKLADSAMKLL